VQLLFTAHYSVNFSVFLMHRRTDLWGLDGEGFLLINQCHILTLCSPALEFDPDRFLDERLHKFLLKNPFIFTPFHAGPRTCLGQQVNFFLPPFLQGRSLTMKPQKFAYYEVSFFLVRTLQQFSSFSLALDAQPPASLPPQNWAGKKGPQGRDRVRPGAYFSMYIKGGLWVRMNGVDEAEI
jgi:hypothetical protein